MQFLVVAVALFFSNVWALADAQNPIGRFHEVTPYIYRGQRPEAEGIKYLASVGFKTVIDLEDSKDAVTSEYEAAKSVGLRFISKPMSGFWPPKDKTVNAVLKALKDPRNFPVFVHCQHGQDRTGLIIGLYRVEQQGWAPKKAYEEMKTLGFHRVLFFLNHYFEERTGYED